MKNLYKLFAIALLALLFRAEAKAQAPSACFTLASPLPPNNYSCGSFLGAINNCSTGVYDSAKWTLFYNGSAACSSPLNCSGPWVPVSTVVFTAPNQATQWQNPIPAVGVYKMVLYIKNSTTLQWDTSSQACIFQIYPKPTVDFTANDSIFCGSGTATFTPTISGGCPPYSGILWTFGNNQTSTSLNPPPQTYNCQPLAYPVTLVANDVNGCSGVMVKPSFIKARCKQTAGFSITNGSSCTAPANLTLAASPSPPGYTYQWYFPPTWHLPPAGTSPAATTPTVVHGFPLGCSDVQLVVVDAVTGCTDTFQQQNVVCVENISVTSFSCNQTQICSGQMVCCTLNVSINPPGNPINISATLAPSGCGASPVGFSYSSPGVYTACFPLTNTTTSACTVTFPTFVITDLNNNCTINYTPSVPAVTVNPAPSALPVITLPYLINYCAPTHQFCWHANTAGNPGGTTYDWYLNPSYSGSSGSNPASFCNTFNGLGQHTVYLKVCLPPASGGCCSYDSFHVQLQKPNFTFAGDTIQGCGPLHVDFTASNHTAADSLYWWCPGDCNGCCDTTHTNHYSHTYSLPFDSCYTVKCVLIQKAVGGFACTDTVIKTKYIKVGHAVKDTASIFPHMPCLIKKSACVTLTPSIPGFNVGPYGAGQSQVSLPFPPGQCPPKLCDWYFTRPFSLVPLLHSFNCDTPKICFNDTGYYDGWYRFCIGGCCDTVHVDTPVVVNGIIGTIKDSVWCVSGGGGSNTVTFHPTFKIRPNPTWGYVYLTWYFPITISGPLTLHDSMYYGPLGGPSITPAYPSHTVTFPNQGNFQACLYICDPNQSCPCDTTCKTIQVQRTIAVINTGPPYIQCRPATWSFSAAGSSPSNPYPAIIRWSFCDSLAYPNGTPYSYNTGLTVSHTFDTCGFFCAKLVLSNASLSCKDSTVFTGIRVVDFKPIFTLIPGVGCNPCLKLVNQSTYCLTGFDSTYVNWGDGTYSYNSTVWDTLYHCTSNLSPGSHQVYVQLFDTMTGLSNAMCMRALYVPQTYSSSGVLADFNFSTDTLICANTVVDFISTGVAYGNPISNYCWHVDSGKCVNYSGQAVSSNCTSSVADIMGNTFPVEGYYSVRLFVGNSTCKDSICKTIHVQNPVACFTFKNDSMSCPGLDTLTNCSYGAADTMIVTSTGPFQYTIGFGRPFPNKIVLPLGIPGTYNVCLQLINGLVGGGGCSDSVCKTITVLGPTGHVSQTGQTVCAGVPVCLGFQTNSLANPFVFYCDGSVVQIPYSPAGNYTYCHSYQSFGTCKNAIYICDGGGCCYPLYDTITVDQPIADFGWSPHGSFCGPKTVIFTDSSHKTVYNLNQNGYQWTFYNHLGNIISTSSRHDTVMRTFYPPDTISAQLIIVSQFGCYDTIRKNNIVILHPMPTASFNIFPDTLCINQCVQFLNTSTNPEPSAGYQWYFDYPNLTPASNIDSPTVCYTTPGNYNTMLIDSSISGCVDTSNIHLIVTLPNLVANFTMSNDTLCGTSGTVTFTNTSVPLFGVTFCWNFGDLPGDDTTCQSTALSPTHTFNLTPGSSGDCFTVRLKLNSIYGCQDSVKYNLCIFPNPTVGMLALPTVSCDPLFTSFSDASSSLVPITNYYLDFGNPSPNLWNGGVSPIPPAGVNHSYTPAGSYTATYTVTTATGCISSTTVNFTVNPNPVANAGPDVLMCAGDVICLGVPAIANTSYNWFPCVPGFSPSCNVSNPCVHPSVTTTYNLEVVNSFGCRDTDNATLTVQPLVSVVTRTDSCVCYGQPITISASGGQTYLWYGLNSGFTSTSPSITVTPLFNEVYQVNITGPCNNDSAQVNVCVYQPPPITLEPNVTTIAGQPYSILSVGNGNVLWRPPYAIDCPTCLNPIVSPEVNTTYHVTLTDIHGCVDSAAITVNVLCDRTNVLYIPNAFTPSQPGANDHFYLQGTGIKEVNFLRIYNRWGDLMYSDVHVPINNKDRGWDGNFNGHALSSDVFMYQMDVECANGTIFPVSGNFTLIR